MITIRYCFLSPKKMNAEVLLILRIQLISRDIAIIAKEIKIVTTNSKMGIGVSRKIDVFGYNAKGNKN